MNFVEAACRMLTEHTPLCLVASGRANSVDPIRIIEAATAAQAEARSPQQS